MYDKQYLLLDIQVSVLYLLMCVSSNDCPSQVNWLKTGRKLLGQRNVVPEYAIDDGYVDNDNDDDGNDDHDHLRKTTRCIAVRNSSRERQPSCDTEII